MKEVEVPTNYDMITWFHACLIVAVIFIFFAGWIGIFVFVYTNKRKAAKRVVKKVMDKGRLTVINNGNQRRRNEHREYQSQSAFAVDEMNSADVEHVAQFLNICKDIDIFEGSSRQTRTGTTSRLNLVITPITSLRMDNDPSIVGHETDDAETSVESDTSFEQMYGPGHKGPTHPAQRKITDYTHSVLSIDI